ncbi:uncharacterized protein LOC130943668 isoform X2 [Arachis stenosperma]|uniref:uncharacterized protein LOC130943668 isoform X2 n=1 Tax=Arachis stenosperma TaxID=217475 RepID=UPI0025AD345A|nr:uncharacterized protein LOC130943668 isoform X2 [Arachis stenosperma]
MMSTSLPGYHILHCEVIFRGSIPWWQLLRGSVERSSASASLLYLPLFLLVKVSKESSYSSDNSDEEEEKASKTPQKSDVKMVDAVSAKKVLENEDMLYLLSIDDDEE